MTNGTELHGSRLAPPPDPELPSAPVARHLLPITASVTGSGSLAVGGVDLVELASEVGTPLFVYDEQHLRMRCREAVAAFGPGVAYGTKAFLCKAMAALAYEEGMALDVSTGGELAVAQAAGVPGDHLVMHGNNKSTEELKAAVDAGVARLVVDSFDEIDRIRQMSSAGLLGGRTLNVLVRVTPGVEAHTHEYVMTGQEDTKFGFSLAAGTADEAIELLGEIAGVRLAGVHAHVGSQIFRVDVFAREIASLAPLIRRHGVAECCVGGGLGAAYLNGEHAPSMAEWAAVVHAACRASRISSQVRVSAEPGRSVVATAGLTLYRIGTVKRLRGLRTYVAVDGGMSDNPRPVLYNSGYEAFLPRRPGAERPEAVRVVGKHCESGDVLVDDARLPAGFEVGDVLATPVTGAYGHAMASNYNRVPRPAVVFVRDGGVRVVVRRETTEDLLRLDG